MTGPASRPSARASARRRWRRLRTASFDIGGVTAAPIAAAVAPVAHRRRSVASVSSRVRPSRSAYSNAHARDEAPGASPSLTDDAARCRAIAFAAPRTRSRKLVQSIPRRRAASRNDAAPEHARSAPACFCVSAERSMSRKLCPPPAEPGGRSVSSRSSGARLAGSLAPSGRSRARRWALLATRWRTTPTHHAYTGTSGSKEDSPAKLRASSVATRSAARSSGSSPVPRRAPPSRPRATTDRAASHATSWRTATAAARAATPSLRRTASSPQVSAVSVPRLPAPPRSER